jgi:hypothetical protein
MVIVMDLVVGSNPTNDEKATETAAVGREDAILSKQGT